MSQLLLFETPAPPAPAAPPPAPRDFRARYEAASREELTLWLSWLERNMANNDERLERGIITESVWAETFARQDTTREVMRQAMRGK